MGNMKIEKVCWLSKTNIIIDFNMNLKINYQYLKTNFIWMFFLCRLFWQILQKAESEVAAYDDQIVILWMTLSQLCQTYKTLTKCKERNDLYQHIFL